MATAARKTTTTKPAPVTASLGPRELNNVALYPDRPGPLRSFTAIEAGTYDHTHQGKGLVLDDVIASYARLWQESKENIHDHTPEDTVIFEGDVVAAILRYQDDGTGNYQVLKPSWEAATNATNGDVTPGHIEHTPSVPPGVRSVTITNPEFSIDELIVELHEIHRYRVDDGDDVQEVEQQILVDGRHVATLTPDDFDDLLKVTMIEDAAEDEDTDDEQDDDPEPAAEAEAPAATASADTDEDDGDDEDDDTISADVALERLRKREVFFNLDQLYKAQDHRAAAVRDQDRIASNDPEKTRLVSEYKQRAYKYARHATRRVVLSVLRARERHDEVAAAKRGDCWNECGIRTDGRIVIVAPTFEENGDVDHDPCFATVVNCEDRRLAEIEDEPRYRTFQIHDTHPAFQGSWTTEEGPGVTLRDAVATARDAIAYELQHGNKPSDRIILEGGKVVATVKAADVLAEAKATPAD